MMHAHTEYTRVSQKRSTFLNEGMQKVVDTRTKFIEKQVDYVEFFFFFLQRLINIILQPDCR